MARQWRELRPDDLAAWSALTGAVARDEQTSSEFSADDLAEELDDPSIDPRLDTVAVLEDDVLVAAGQVYLPVMQTDQTVRALFAGHVHPDHRRRGIGSELLTKLERRAVTWARARFPDAEPIRARTDAAQTAPAAIALLEARGYRPIRYYHELARELDPASDLEPAAGGPGAPELVDYRPALDAELLAAHHEAFAGHWGSAPPDAARWRTYFTGSRTFRPACSTLAVVGRPSGHRTVGGYVLAHSYQPGEVYLGHIGVRPDLRRAGLARRMLARSLARAAQEGYHRARLDVDSANADGAGGLYVSAGFQPAQITVVYEQPDGTRTGG
jgi:ribosomal protein S18 acetylase RimI-like enzyme